MTVAQAAHLTVHEGELEAKVIAAKMGLKHQMLLNKVNVNNTTHHLYLLDAVKLMQVTGDTRIMEALANELGGIYVPSVVPATVSPNIAGDLAKMSGDFAALMREIASDLADGKISDNELEDVESEAANLRAALAVLLSDLRRLNRDARASDTPKEVRVS